MVETEQIIELYLRKHRNSTCANEIEILHVSRYSTYEKTKEINSCEQSQCNTMRRPRDKIKPRFTLQK